MNNRHKRYNLHRTVIFEKFSRKLYIKNANEFLIRLGILVYIEKEDGQNFLSGRATLINIMNNNNNFQELLNLYGVDILCDFFKTFTTNHRLKKLKHNPILEGPIPNLTIEIRNSDSHLQKYVHGFADIHGRRRSILIKSNSIRVPSQLGMDYHEDKLQKKRMY